MRSHLRLGLKRVEARLPALAVWSAKARAERLRGLVRRIEADPEADAAQEALACVLERRSQTRAGLWEPGWLETDPEVGRLMGIIDARTTASSQTGPTLTGCHGPTAPSLGQASRDSGQGRSRF
jgi:hypothetical protein